ncbi:restriction endonuclease subunit S [Staphylococcus arlettae]|uniref:restriction endonuclease subunit S n=1 Tax=Staphylococcus arlettae TaxID=29378 RepID=UPI002DBB2A32|nr:restriction endonuclease subunit S [Staphylococcus arlettae]MEB5899563.1 restriction endonuclease subunit S [Staphylococcus arlettae]
MTNEIKNVPELRFPEFEDEWKQKRLGEVAEIIGGGTPSTSNPQYWGGDINWYSPIEIGENIYLNESKNKITKMGLKKSSAKILPIGSVLFTSRAGIGNTAILKKEAATNQGFKSIVPKDNKLDTYFIFSRTNELKKYGEINGAGSTFVEVSGKEMEKMPMLFPEISEQQKIGNFFSKLDRQIELEEQKLEKLEEQKKGYMQKIFSQELRFKDENGNDYPGWETNKIEDIANVTKGFTPSTKNNDYWYNKNKNWLSIAGMDEKYLYHGNKGITDLASQKHDKVEENTLIMSFKLTLGKLGIVKEPMYTNEAICHFNWKSKYVNTEYVYYYLSYINIDSFGSQAVKGITLNNDSINSIVIKLPSLSEQHKISDLFRKYDSFIEKQASKIKLFKERKKGFLQKMFV